MAIQSVRQSSREYSFYSRDGFRCHSCLEAIGRGRFHCYELSRDRRESPLKKLLRHDHSLEALLPAQTPLFDLSDILELSSEWLDATGNVILLKIRSGPGEVIELWSLPALRFIIEKGADKIHAYYTFFQPHVKISAEDIIHIKPSEIRTAPFYGHALHSDIMNTTKANSALRLYQQSFFENDYVPRDVLKFPNVRSLLRNR